MDNTQKQTTKWFDLLELARLCPGEVPVVQVKQTKNKQGETTPDTGMVAVTGNTRLLLFALVQHAAGDTDETWVSRRTLRHETQMAINTLDTAISNLKRADLLRIRKEFDETKVSYRHIWIVQRARLAALVGERVNDKLIADTIKAVMEDRSSSLKCSQGRVEQTKSALYEAAGKTIIEIAVLNDFLDKNKVELLVYLSEDKATPPARSSSQTESLPKDRQEYMMRVIDDARERDALYSGSCGPLFVPESESNLTKKLIEDQLPGAQVTVGKPQGGKVPIAFNWVRPKLVA
jgi:energy-converting hydrogenase A subunit M